MNRRRVERGLSELAVDVVELVGPEDGDEANKVSSPSPSPRTKWTRRIPHPVLIGHAASRPQDVENYVVQRYITNPCRPRPLPSKRSDTCMTD